MTPQDDKYTTILKRTFGDDRIRENVVLAPYTTFKIGGPADLFFETQQSSELAQIISICRDQDLPFFVLGVGANIIFEDLGFRGLVIRNMAQNVVVDSEKKQITADSGAIIFPDLIETAISHGLSGLEHYAGIPSTVGGALWQNLHFLSPPPERSRTVFIEELVLEAELLLSTGEIKTVGLDYFDFGYDYSTLHIIDDYVLKATFQMEEGDPKRMREIVKANLQWRGERHPPLDTEPSVGSIFKKIEGIGAGRLIDQSGMKGKTIGGIEITHRHANIMINRGGAKAEDVREMIKVVQETVAKDHGYFLETEVKFVGERQKKSGSKRTRIDKTEKD